VLTLNFNLLGFVIGSKTPRNLLDLYIDPLLDACMFMSEITDYRPGASEVPWDESNTKIILDYIRMLLDCYTGSSDVSIEDYDAHLYWRRCEATACPELGSCAEVPDGEEMPCCSRVSRVPFTYTSCILIMKSDSLLPILQCLAIRYCSPGSHSRPKPRKAIRPPVLTPSPPSICTHTAHQKAHWKKHKPICFKPTW
jgi:hypothetical protein